MLIDGGVEPASGPSVGAVGGFPAPSGASIGASEAGEFASGGGGPGCIEVEAVAEVEACGFGGQVLAEVDFEGAAVVIAGVDIDAEGVVGWVLWVLDDRELVGSVDVVERVDRVGGGEVGGEDGLCERADGGGDECEHGEMVPEGVLSGVWR